MASPHSGAPVTATRQSGNPFIDGMIHTKQWATPSELTYSFPGSGSKFATGSLHFGQGYNDPGLRYFPFHWQVRYFSEAQKLATRSVLELYEQIGSMRFSELNEGLNPDAVGDFRFMSSGHVDVEGAGGIAFLPHPDSPVAGDVFLSLASSDPSRSFAPGSYQFHTLMHETGHALGLSHPLESELFPKQFDSVQYSIMSYKIQGMNRAEFYPTTPMVLDYQALEHLYGKKAHAAGDSDYVYDDHSTYFETIHDTGGYDRIVYNGSDSALICLIEGIELGSRIGKNIRVYSTETRAAAETLNSNVFISFGTLIEEAIGGSGPDILVGNASNNVLNGRGGNDEIYAQEGDDLIVDAAGSDLVDGGAGFDTVVYEGLRFKSSLMQTDAAGSGIFVQTANGRDHLIDIERVVFEDSVLAFDMEGTAGLAAKITAAVLGAKAVSNATIMGQLVRQIEDGQQSAWSFSQNLLQAQLGQSAQDHASVVTLLYTNVVGFAPSESELRHYQGLLDNGHFDEAGLTLFASEVHLNLQNFGYDSLAENGLLLA